MSDEMDVVYVTREGENPELRYSLRSLRNVDHDRVWIFGGAPSWVDESKVQVRKRAQRGSPYLNVRDHIMAACKDPEVSDPFLLWNDDFYAMKPVDEVAVLHRGPLPEVVAQTANLKTAWAKGLRETATMVSNLPDVTDPVSYDLHVPMIVYKTHMLDALRLSKKIQADAVHLRTIYGNVAGLGGTQVEDPKMHHRNNPFPDGPWLSSNTDSFRSAVEPVLRYLFPDPSPYERG